MSKIYSLYLDHSSEDEAVHNYIFAPCNVLTILHVTLSNIWTFKISKVIYNINAHFEQLLT